MEKIVMVSRSNDRINIIIKIISKVLGIGEDCVREYVIQSDTGQEILDKNQVVLHDQATANAYDILMELPRDVVTKHWETSDIAQAYNELIMKGDEEIPEAKFVRLTKREKDIIRKKRKDMKQAMEKDRELKRQNARMVEAVRGGDGVR